MTIYAFETTTVRPLPEISFTRAGILARTHLQTAIRQNVAIIAEEFP